MISTKCCALLERISGGLQPLLECPANVHSSDYIANESSQQQAKILLERISGGLQQKITIIFSSFFLNEPS